MMVVTLVNSSVPLLYFLKVIILMKEFPLILLEIPFLGFFLRWFISQESSASFSVNLNSVFAGVSGHKCTYASVHVFVYVWLFPQLVTSP